MLNVLCEIGWKRDDADALIDIAYEEAERPREHIENAMHGSRRILYEMLVRQGYDAATAQVLALHLPGLSLTTLTANSRHGREMLDVNNTRFKQFRDEGRPEAWVDHRKGEWPTDTLFRVFQLLYASAWREVHEDEMAHKQRWWPPRD